MEGLQRRHVAVEAEGFQMEEYYFLSVPAVVHPKLLIIFRDTVWFLVQVVKELRGRSDKVSSDLVLLRQQSECILDINLVVLVIRLQRKDGQEVGEVDLLLLSKHFFELFILLLVWLEGHHFEELLQQLVGKFAIIFTCMQIKDLTEVTPLHCCYLV